MTEHESFYERNKRELEEEGVLWMPINQLHLELFRKIEKITETLDTMKDAISDDADNYFISKDNLDTYLFDSYTVTVKLGGCLNCEMYLIYMENASVIRFYMRQLETFTSGMDFYQDHTLTQTLDRNYIDVLRQEVKSFKETFVEWVKHFEKDEFEDDWGLY